MGNRLVCSEPNQLLNRIILRYDYHLHGASIPICILRSGSIVLGETQSWGIPMVLAAEEQ